MNGKVTLEIALEAMRRGGAVRAQAMLRSSEKTELNVDAGEMSLLRTTANVELSMTALVDDRKGTIAINRTDLDAVNRAAAEAIDAARASRPDPANDIAPACPPGSFGYGDAAADRDGMYDSLRAFLDYARDRHPRIRLEQCIHDFTRTTEQFANTNGVALEAGTGIYGFGSLFTGKDGRKTSSFNFAEATRRKLDAALCQWGSVDELMRQAGEQLDPRPMDGKFVGDLLITPDCLVGFITMLDETCLGDGALIKGTSPYRESLGECVASSLFTLRSCPISPSIQQGYYFTSDGFPAQDSVLIDRGRLAGFNLSLYGSRRTGKPRAPNGGGCWVVDPGTTGLPEVIASMKRGVLLCRFSGDQSGNGDFSGVAKNSYLIEGGKIATPLTETMVAGNLPALLLAVTAVSRERIDFGSRVLPWVKVGGATISGK